MDLYRAGTKHDKDDKRVRNRVWSVLLWVGIGGDENFPSTEGNSEPELRPM